MFIISQRITMVVFFVVLQLCCFSFKSFLGNWSIYSRIFSAIFINSSTG